MKIKKCRACGGTKLKHAFNLGNQRLTGVFLSKKYQKVSGGNLSLVLCGNCTLLQLENSFNPQEMYGSNYGYESALNQSMVKHLKNKAKKLSKLANINSNKIIIDIGSNDGTFLSFFKKSNRLIGIDPTIKKFSKKYRKDIIKVPDFFSYTKIESILRSQKAKLVTSLSMFYDLEDPIAFARDIEKILDKDGIWHLEQSYMPQMLKNVSYDTICHEHLEYYSLKSLSYIFEKVNLRILDLEINSVNGGSFALNVVKNNSSLKSNNTLLNWTRNEEKKMKLNNINTYRKFFLNVKKHKATLIDVLKKISKNNQKVIGYGASTKGNVILQFLKINPKLIPLIVEVNKFKFNKFTPGSKIKIVSEKMIKKIKPDYMLVLPWHFKNFILEKEKNFLNNGGKLIFPLPEVEIY
jgi:hypothetical protein